jgi:hypothetical protein
MLFVLTVCAGFLDLSNNTLTGMILTEIVSLVNLGEFVGRRLPLSFILMQCALVNTL